MLNKKQVISVLVAVLAVAAALILVSGKAGGRDNNAKAPDNLSQKPASSQDTMHNNRSEAAASSAKAYVPQVSGVTSK